MLKIYEIVGAGKLIGYDDETKQLYDIVEIAKSSAFVIPKDKEKEVKRVLKKTPAPGKLKPITVTATESAEDKAWSRNHDRCVQCFQTDSPHLSGGFCRKCYQANYRNSNGDKKTSETKNKYECLDCSHSFKSEPLATLVRGCPKCSGNVIQK